MRHLIVGTGRSGTGWISRQLGFRGLKWSHEQVFGLQNRYAEERANPQWDGGSSWLAVPFLSEVRQDGVQIYHLVRDPLKTVASYFIPPETFTPMFLEGRPNPYTDFAIQHQPALSRPHLSRLDQIVHFYVLWTNWIFQQLGHRDVFRLEDQAAILIEEITGAVPDRLHSINSRRHLDVGLIQNLELRDQLLALREEFGYADD